MQNAKLFVAYYVNAKGKMILHVYTVKPVKPVLRPPVLSNHLYQEATFVFISIKVKFIRIKPAPVLSNTFRDFHLAACLIQLWLYIIYLFNPLYTEQNLPHYILEESNFNFRYVWL